MNSEFIFQNYFISYYILILGKFSLATNASNVASHNNIELINTYSNQINKPL